MSKWIRAGAALALRWRASPASAQRADPVPTVAGPIVGPVASEHRATINGASIPYRAIFREYELKSADGRPQATISATAYVRTDAGAASARPVMFLFNGGPGASSSPLHFPAFGPRLRPPGARRHRPLHRQSGQPARRRRPGVRRSGRHRLQPGAAGRQRRGLLGAARRCRGGAAAGPQLAARQSSRGLADLHRRRELWRLPAGDDDARRRRPQPARPADDLAGDRHGRHRRRRQRRQSTMSFSLPTMAIAAWHHQKVDRRGRTAEQYLRRGDARSPRATISPPCTRARRCPSAERERIAQRMSEFIGLPAADILAADLRVDDDLFVDGLLRDRNQLVGRLDSRVTAPVRPPARADRPAAANDPSLGLGATNVIRSAAITRYMARGARRPVRAGTMSR